MSQAKWKLKKHMFSGDPEVNWLNLLLPVKHTCEKYEIGLKCTVLYVDDECSKFVHANLT